MRTVRPVVVLALAALALAYAAAPAGYVRTARADGSTPSCADAGAADVAKSVADVQAFYNASTTFRSDFEQKFWVKAYSTEKSSRGHVTFAKPGKMDWVYDDPHDNRVVSDGNVIKVFDAANKQMFEQPIDKSQYPAALSFLTGTGLLSQSFDFERVCGDQMKFPGGYVLVGTPKQPTPAYSKVLFYVDSATSQVRRVMVIDGQGNRNRFDFINPQVNLPVPPAQFRFSPPAGTSVIKP